MSRPAWVRWLLVPIGIFLLGAGSIAVVQCTEHSLTGKPTVDLRVILFLTSITFYLWMRLGSELSFKGQWTGIAMYASIALVLLESFRIDGFLGDGRPIWVWRWSRPPVIAEPGGASSGVKTESSPVDLSVVTMEDFPAFRGADRSGVVTKVGWNFDRDVTPQLLWRRSVGQGWSSFAVRGGYCVTQEQAGDSELVTCYELQTGRAVWQHADVAHFEEVTSGLGPRATPTIDAGCVYAQGATGILNCLDGATGVCRWSVHLPAKHGSPTPLFGWTTSPLVHAGLVIVSPGGPSAALAAHDQHTGEMRWTGGNANASYSSPQLAPFALGDQILLFHADGLSGHDLKTGAEQWTIPWISNPAERNNVAQPVPLPSVDSAANDRIVLASGYGRGAALLNLILKDGKQAVETVWFSRQLKPKFASIIVHEDAIYGLDDGILTCLDLATGQRRWKQGRYGHGQLLLAGDHLIIQAENGMAVIVAADPLQFREVLKFKALADRTWNHPVLAGNLLLVRNDREAACFRLPIEISR